MLKTISARQLESIGHDSDTLAAGLVAFWNDCTLRNLPLGEWSLWYREAYATCETLSRKHGVSVWYVASIVAISSQQKVWQENLEWAIEFLSGNLLPHFPDVVTKAFCLSDDDDTLSGRKVTNFRAAILSSGIDGCTVDRWAYRAAFGTAWGQVLEPKTTIDDSGYSVVEDAYRIATVAINEAKGTHYTVSEVQAALWCAIRGGK